jgi:bifunctional ADP-heptose synthase (sugar kinase/adenylyltransferase)
MNNVQCHGSEVDQYLATIRAKYSCADVRTWLEKTRALKVLVIGDAILDVYQYSEPLGPGGKEPTPVVNSLPRIDRFIGGAEAVAEHASACSDAVNCLTGPPVTKRRYVNAYPFQKVFESYEGLNEEAASLHGDLFSDTVGGDVAAADLVIVADYGHGFLTPKLIQTIIQQAKVLAINVQVNAGNHGYSTISKYSRADFVSLSERELRLDARDKKTPIDDLMIRYRYGAMLVTRGAHGCKATAPGWVNCDAPAFATHAVDRVGAGDAVFAVAACCAAVGMPLDLLTFVAAVVGTIAVGIVGNAHYIERDALLQAIEQWLG